VSTRALDRAAGFRHEALFYTGISSFVDATLPFIGEGLVAEEPVLVAVNPHKAQLLRHALGDRAQRVDFVDMNVVGQNPARIIPVWRKFVDDHASFGQPVRGVGEPVWPGRSRAELDECHFHESLLNTAFDAGPAWSLVCPYDTELLESDALSEAEVTHPHLGRQDSEGGLSRRYSSFRGPHSFGQSLTPPRTSSVAMEFNADEIGRIRRVVNEWATYRGLSQIRASELVLAVHEAAANSVRHGGGRGVLEMWSEDGALLCEVRDGGVIHDPLVGRSLPSIDQEAGRGIWLINQICDLAQVRSSPEHGTVVRMVMRL
jgi:anti-sigma regulatory factor (Ser/Thr protein kinase)